jgi:hypothetical protein
MVGDRLAGVEMGYLNDGEERHEDKTQNCHGRPSP